MTLASLSSLAESAVARLPIHLAGAVDLRRDLYLFVDFVRRADLKRGHRDNSIPKAPALKLARILSHAGEKEAMEEDGHGVWSDSVSWIARQMGLVKFDEKGIYAGYSSHEPSFPDNYIEVDAKRFAAYLAGDGLSKEQAILAALVEMTENELFNEATLIPGERFDQRGCAVGPASRMDLRTIRRGLLALLAELPAGEWLATQSLVEHVRQKAPRLILDPKLRERPPNRWKRLHHGKGQHAEDLDELYENFREHSVVKPYGKGLQLREGMPDVFARVEGRYLQFFLQEIPYLCGFVDLAMKPPSKARGDDPLPPREPVHAFRITPRLQQVVRGAPELSRVSVTVLPNSDVVVEAPSYPDRELDALMPLCRLVKEDGPTHLLHLDQKQIMALVASGPLGLRVGETLARLSGRPLPPNVATELAGWCGHAEKLTVYTDVALVELRGEGALGARVRKELGDLVVDDRPDGFLLVRDSDRVLTLLEERNHVPRSVAHRRDRFAVCDGPLGAPAQAAPEEAAEPPAPKKKSVRLSLQDLVGYRAADAEFLALLSESLRRGGVAATLADSGQLLLVPASNLTEVRVALGRLKDRFDVDLGR